MSDETISGDLTAACANCGKPRAAHGSYGECDGLRIDFGRRPTYAPASRDLTAEDALLAVQVMDNYLSLSKHIQQLPGAVAMNDLTYQKIKAVREKLRGLL